MTRRKVAKPSKPRQIGANDNAPSVANDNAPTVIMLGDLPVVSRHPLDMLSPGELARINRIEAALRGKRKAEAARLALDYERAQGITTEERIAATRPANDTDCLIEEMIALAMGDYAARYRPPEPPKQKRGKGKAKARQEKADPLAGLKPGDLTQGEIDRLIKADDKLRSKKPGLIEEAKVEIAKIHAAAKKRALAASLAQAKAELEQLERLRDPEVKIEVVGDARHTRLSNRDGLEALWIEGKLDDRQRAAGRTYRDAYERALPGPASNARSIYRRLMTAGCSLGKAEQNEGDAADALLRMEAAVKASTSRPAERARRLKCLRLVAGEGQTVRQVAGASGKAHVAHILSLREALDTIA